MANIDKTKFSVRVDKKLLEIVDAHLDHTTAQNRTEFIEDALKFYLGFQKSKEIENYLLKSISSMVSGYLRDNERRTTRILNALREEHALTNHIIASQMYGMDEETIAAVRLLVRKLLYQKKGDVSFEDAYAFQHRLDDDEK